MIELLISILLFILGASIGSFLSVIIFRTHKNIKNPFFSRSMCPYCKKKLKFRFLVPIFSWLLLGGKCGYCGKKISSHYLILEIMTGLLFMATFLNWNFIRIVENVFVIETAIFYQFLYFIIIFTFLTLIFFYDLLYREIPDKFSLPAIALTIAGSLIFSEPEIISMLIGGSAIFLFFAGQYFISGGKWIGGGDLRLGFLMGALLGWEKGLMALILAYILGALICLPLLIKGDLSRKTEVAFGPFLITGIITVIFFGEQIMNFYLQNMII